MAAMFGWTKRRRAREGAARAVDTRGSLARMQPYRIALAASLAAGLLALGARPVAAGPAAVAIRGGTVLPISQPPIEGGTVLIGSDGKIAAVGKDLAIPPGARVIDAAGQFGLAG